MRPGLPYVVQIRAERLLPKIAVTTVTTALLCGSEIEGVTIGTMWGPRSIAKLMQITTITRVYGTYDELVTWGYKSTYNVWGPHIVDLLVM